MAGKRAPVRAGRRDSDYYNSLWFSVARAQCVAPRSLAVGRSLSLGLCAPPRGRASGRRLARAVGARGERGTA